MKAHPLTPGNRAPLIGIVAVIAATMFACGADPATGSRAEGGNQPTTARALAFVVEDHLADQVGKATSARPELDGPRAVGGVGTAVRFRAEGEPSKPAVSVAVGDKAAATEFTCARLQKDFYNGCVATGGGVLFWEKETPEEDPGVIYVDRTTSADAIRDGKQLKSWIDQP